MPWFLAGRLIFDSGGLVAVNLRPDDTADLAFAQGFVATVDEPGVGRAAWERLRAELRPEDVRERPGGLIAYPGPPGESRVAFDADEAAGPPPDDAASGT